MTVLNDAAGLREAVVDLIVRVAGESVAAHGRFDVALAGGETPRGAYELLARRAKAVPWNRTDVFFSDERCVPAGDARSNAAMARAALLSLVPIDERRIHAIACDGAPAEAADRYDAELRGHFLRDADPVPATTFDLALLGAGTDGHTASLFPGDPALAERERWALAVRAPAGVTPSERVTLTLPVLNRARHVVFMVAGDGKREIVRRVLSRGDPRRPLPAALVHGVESTTWLLDSAAAAGDSMF